MINPNQRLFRKPVDQPFADAASSQLTEACSPTQSNRVCSWDGSKARGHSFRARTPARMVCSRGFILNDRTRRALCGSNAYEPNPIPVRRSLKLSGPHLASFRVFHIQLSHATRFQARGTAGHHNFTSLACGLDIDCGHTRNGIGLYTWTIRFSRSAFAFPEGSTSELSAAVVVLMRSLPECFTPLSDFDRDRVR